MTSLYSGSLYRDSTVTKSRSGEPLVLSREGEVGEEVFFPRDFATSQKHRKYFLPAVIKPTALTC